MEKTEPESGRNLIPFETIVAAVSGDEDAIRAVVSHYDRYITTLSIREQFDSDGICRKYVDEDMKRWLTAKLMQGILLFHMDRGN